MYPVKVIHPPMEPAVSIIVPYAEGKPFNPIYVCANDEVLIAKGGSSIGEARIEAAKKARNEWLVFMDSDAVYPPDYIPNIKYYIRTYGWPMMATKRKGGFGDLFFQVHEHGLIVRKDVFLERTKNYPEGVRQLGRRTDVADYFRDAVKIPVEYYHSFTTGEKAALSALLGLLIISVALLKRHSSKIESTEEAVSALKEARKTLDTDLIENVIKFFAKSESECPLAEYLSLALVHAKYGDKEKARQFINNVIEFIEGGGSCAE